MVSKARGSSFLSRRMQLKGDESRMRTGFLRCHGEQGRNAQADEAPDRDERSYPLMSKSGRGFVSKRLARRLKWRRSGLRVGFSRMHPCLMGQGRIDE